MNNLTTDEMKSIVLSKFRNAEPDQYDNFGSFVGKNNFYFHLDGKIDYTKEGNTIDILKVGEDETANNEVTERVKEIITCKVNKALLAMQASLESL
jgi:hypothetical protein